MAVEYAHVLQLYLQAPTVDVSMDEFQTFAFDRIKLLQIVEQISLMGHSANSQQWESILLEQLKIFKLRKYAHLIKSNGDNPRDVDLSVRREDHISHFILRLYFCRTPELRDWFIQREVELFKIRYNSLNTAGITAFCDINSLQFTPVTKEKKNEIIEDLIQSTSGYNHSEIEAMDFYEIPFQEVSDLVEGRKIYIKEGNAYVPLMSCIISQYKKHLDKELIKANQKIPFLYDERVASLCDFIERVTSGNTEFNKNQIQIVDLERLSSISFPLCMKNIYENIKSTHHLKHQGRLQFGLFLKEIGLSAENAVKYWRDEFTIKMDEEQFNRNYVYSILHMYGLVGKRVEKASYDCMKIIGCDVGVGQCHGCPFKQWDENNLRTKLSKVSIHSSYINEIVDLANNENYQTACTKYFTFVHSGVEPKAPIQHPNQYFEESLELTRTVIKSKEPTTESVTSNQELTREPDTSQTISLKRERPIESNLQSTILFHCQGKLNDSSQDLTPNIMNWEEKPGKLEKKLNIDTFQDLNLETINWEEDVIFE